jgi:hypothetical protein
MGPITKTYKILIHPHSTTLTPTKNKQSHQPLGKISKKTLGILYKKYFLVYQQPSLKGQNLPKNLKYSRINLQVACDGHRTINLKIS